MVFVRVGAQHDDLHPALDIARDVGEGFALAEGRLGLVDEESRAAEGVHRGLEGEAGAERGLLKEHHHLLRVESPAIRGGVGLDVVREGEHAGQLGGGEVGDGAEIAAGERNVGGGFGARGFEFLHSSGLSCQFLSSGEWGRGGVRQLFGQDFVKSGKGLVDVFFFDDVRRQEAQNRFAGAVDEDAALHHLAEDGFGQFGGVELDGEHEAQAADIGYRGVSFGELGRAARGNTCRSRLHDP